MAGVSLILTVSDLPSADGCMSASMAELRPARCCTVTAPTGAGVAATR